MEAPFRAVFSLIDEGSRLLVESGIEPREARIQSERLLFHRLGISKSQMAEIKPSIIDETMKRDFLSLLGKRSHHVPLQYLEGTASFMDFEFRVTPDVLIPRPETENLVERIVLCFKKRSLESLRILDLGTGSGCIILSLLKYFPASIGTGTDISKEALVVAENNARRLEVERRINWIHSDFFEGISGGKYDVIVSNPPYISEPEWLGLAEEVRQEPYQALVPGPAGFESYEKIITRAAEYLNPDGFLFFEAGYNQALKIKNLLMRNSFKNIQIFRDDNGIERIVQASFK